MAKIPCPVPGYDQTGDDGQPLYYVTVPDEWKGEHARAFWNSTESLAANSKRFPPFVERFLHSLALADDYNLPGLTGKPENWDYDKLPLKIMYWAVHFIYNSYMDCFTVKKNWLMPSSNGSSQETTTSPAGGSLEAARLEQAL